jgi:hypothetical protein
MRGPFAKAVKWFHYTGGLVYSATGDGGNIAPMVDGLLAGCGRLK